MIHFIDSLKSVSPIFSVIIRCIDRMHICMQMISRSINNKCAPNQSTRNAISFAPSCRYLRQLKHINTHIYPCHVVCSSVRTNILISFDWIDSQKMKQKKNNDIIKSNESTAMVYFLRFPFSIIIIITINQSHINVIIK